MDRVFYVFILLIILVVHMVIIHNQNIRNASVGTFSSAIFTMILYYEIIPIIYLCSNPNKLDSGQILVNQCSLGQFIVAVIVIVLFTLFFYISYRRYNNRRKHEFFRFSEYKMDRALHYVTWISFCIGSVSMIVYIIAFGGVARLLSYAEYMRSFATSGTEFTSYIVSIMVIPARMITVTPIVVIPIIEKSRNKLLYKFIFVVSMILAVIFLLFNAGKAGIITFALCFIIPFLHKRIKHPWKITIIFGIVGVKILDLLDALFVYLQNGNWKITTNTIMESITGFTYPFRNLLFLPQMTEEFGFRWGRDFIIGPINIIPGVFFEPSYVITSKFFVGNNWKSIGGVPDDIITFGYLQLGLIGVIGVAVLFGIICGKIDRILSQIDSNSSYYFVATSIVISIFNYMASADITGLIRNQFQLYLCVFCVLYASSRRNYE